MRQVKKVRSQQTEWVDLAITGNLSSDHWVAFNARRMVLNSNGIFILADRCNELQETCPVLCNRWNESYFYISLFQPGRKAITYPHGQTVYIQAFLLEQRDHHKHDHNNCCSCFGLVYLLFSL